MRNEKHQMTTRAGSVRTFQMQMRMKRPSEA